MSSSEEESFECGLCLVDVRDIAETPIWQCSEGHMQCDQCFQSRGGASGVGSVRELLAPEGENDFFAVCSKALCLLCPGQATISLLI